MTIFIQNKGNIINYTSKSYKKQWKNGEKLCKTKDGMDHAENSFRYTLIRHIGLTVVVSYATGMEIRFMRQTNPGSKVPIFIRGSAEKNRLLPGQMQRSF